FFCGAVLRSARILIRTCLRRSTSLACASFSIRNPAVPLKLYCYVCLAGCFVVRRFKPPHPDPLPQEEREQIQVPVFSLLRRADGHGDRAAGEEPAVTVGEVRRNATL